MMPVEEGRISPASQPDDVGGQRAHPPGVALALAAGAGVGVAGVDDHAAQPAAGDVLAPDLHRGGDTPCWS